jgi:hypothetical protein
MDDHRRIPWVFLLLLVGSGLMLACHTNPTDQAQAPAAQASAAKEEEIKLFDTVTPKRGALRAAAAPLRLRIIPGNQNEADTYYNTIRPALVGFPKPTLAESSISDMLVYYGFPALLPGDLEKLGSAVIMDFEQLRKAVSNPDFEPAYHDHPLQAGEILVTRFFAPKIINVRDKQVNGVPVGGFGWRKVLRFRARDGSPARTAGLDFFYLLFNFTSNDPKFPQGTHAGQIQAILVPVYPTQGKHRDAYFLVYVSLGDPNNPGKVGFFLTATFDLAKVVPDDHYFVPRACGQCHGTVRSDQRGAKVNYLDTDHWIDRTGDDFSNVQADDVLVDGVPQAYTAIRQLNGEIERQNAAVIGPTDPKFALLAVRKWLELHKEGQPDANTHFLPLQRGFAENAGDAVWQPGGSPDQELLPLLNRYCFRCHSSVRYHIFQKQAVAQRRDDLIDRVTTENMPQDRKLDADTKAKILKLLEQLPSPKQ